MVPCRKRLFGEPYGVGPLDGDGCRQESIRRRSARAASFLTEKNGRARFSSFSGRAGCATVARREILGAAPQSATVLFSIHGHGALGTAAFHARREFDKRLRRKTDPVRAGPALAFGLVGSLHAAGESIG